MYSIFGKMGSFLLTFLLFVLSTNITVATKTVSMIAQLDVETATPHQASIDMTDHLHLQHNGVGNPFAKLTSKLLRISTNNVCDFEAHLRLATVCRSLNEGAADDAFTARTLEAARSVYGVRRAICEAVIPATQIPSSCQRLMPATDHRMSQNYLVSSELDHTKSHDLPACIQELKKHHYLWTSYSNNLQDANSLSHMVRSDVELYSAAMVGRDLQNAMNDFRQEMSQVHGTVDAWFDKAIQKAYDLFDTQDELLVRYEDILGNSSTGMIEHFETTNLQLASLDAALLNLLRKTDDSLLSVQVNTDAVTNGMMNMKHTMSEIYSEAALEITTFSHTRMKSVTDLSNTVVDMLTSLVKPANGLEATISAAVNMSSMISDIQLVQMAQAEQQYELAAAVVEKLYTSSELAQNAADTFANISTSITDFDTALSSYATLFDFLVQYDYVLIAVCIYLAISLVLAPLENIVIPRKIVSDIKAAYWALQAAFFLYRILDPVSKLEHIGRLVATVYEIAMHQYQIWFVVSAILASLFLVVDYFLRSTRVNHEQFDVENIRPDIIVEHRRPAICDSQRCRLDSFPQRARHGTTPPGL